MDAPVPPTQVDSLSERQSKSIKSDTPPNRPPRASTRCQRFGNNQHQRGPANNVECFNCHKRGHFGKMCKTRKANVHEVQGGQHNKSEQGSEDAVNFPRDDSTQSLFLGTLSAEHPKGKTTAEQHDRSKVMKNIQLTAYPFHKHATIIVFKGRHRRRGQCHIRSGKQSNIPQPNISTPWPSTTSYSLWGHQIKTLGSCQLYVHHSWNIKRVTFIS